MLKYDVVSATKIALDLVKHAIDSGFISNPNSGGVDSGEKVIDFMTTVVDGLTQNSTNNE